jgi:hypothetical protein
MGAGAIAAARAPWAAVVGGGLLVAAVVAWRRSAPLGIARVAVPWRRVTVGAAGVAALVLAAQLAGVLVRDDGEGPDAVSRSDGRLGLPPLPGGAAYAATLADGSRVRAWRIAPGALHLRVDTSAARCSGGPWREWWHMADLRRVRVGADGAFAARGGRREREPAAVHTAAFAVRGVVDAGGLRGTLVRVDRYRGHVDGACRRVVRFAAPPARG